MQISSSIQVFDTTPLTNEHPVDPEGSLFSYYPEYNPPSLHYHNFLELGYCEHGSGIFIIDGKPVAFNGRCTSIIYPGQIHIAKSTAENKSLWHFLYVDVEKLFYSYPASFIKTIKAMSNQNYNFPCLIPFEENRELYRLTEAIMDEAAKKNPGFLEAIQGMIYSLLTIHGRYMIPKGQEEINNRNFLFGEMGNVINFINTNYMKNISIADLAKVGCTSRASLQRKLTEFIGKSPMQYIHELRLNQAAIMLQDPNIRIIDIANDVGYHTLSCFNRKFLDYYKMSPSMYRKENQK
ncbi:MAG: AraC family transcriptional regulator [Bacilli bacterium]|nr:AraC family transcriptional regulator [Bacilli bacterium]